MKKRMMYRLLSIALSTSLLLPLAACGEEESSRGRMENDDKKEDDDKKGDDKKDENPSPAGEAPASGNGEDPGTVTGPESEDDLFKELSDWSFSFSSGAGGWGTCLYFQPDGSFRGDYHDSEMGSTGPGYSYGTVYICDFEGKCDGYEEISDGIYRLHIASLDYEPDGKETIEDEIRYITSTPYGLENTNELIVYLPGVPLDQLEDSYLEWVAPQHFSQYVGPDFYWYEDYPEELPFAGVYNPADDGYGFYSFPDCDHNKMCLKNMAKMPGLSNRELTVNDDGTYYCEDMDDYGCILVKSVCIPLDASYPNPYDDMEGLIKKCIENIPGESAPQNLYVPSDDYRDDSLSYISGEQIYQASWSTGRNEDMRLCDGIFHFDYIYGDDGSTTKGYALVYMYSVDPDADIVRMEFMNHYLHSLAYSGSFEGLSSESSETGDRWIITKVIGGDGNGGILADEVVWISGDDLETLAEYGIDPDDLTNDYAIGGADGNYQGYALSPDCPIYFRFTDNIFERYRSYDQFCEIMDEWTEYGRLFYLLLDKEDKVVAMYEPYTP